MPPPGSRRSTGRCPARSTRAGSTPSRPSTSAASSASSTGSCSMAEARAVSLPQATTERRTRGISSSFRRGLVLVPPLALAVLEIFHPRPDETLAAVMDVATWFLTFHAIQLVLIGLVGLSVLLLADELGHAR